MGSSLGREISRTVIGHWIRIIHESFVNYPARCPLMPTAFPHPPVFLPDQHGSPGPEIRSPCLDRPERGHPRTWALSNAHDRYIYEHYAEKLRPSLTAWEIGMSLSGLEKAFKKENGITFPRYVNRLRISKAIKLLKGYSLPMSDIAFDCGFTILPIRPESPPKGGSWQSLDFLL
jgi:AraC-like DNA-binding protein